MLPRVDVIGKVQQLYMSGWPVPYLTFVQLFKDLLSDPARVVPKEPSDELKERFRAACMAANVGLMDTEGREKERLREFRERVVPVWRAKLPPEEFARYQEVLDGSLREAQRGTARDAAAQSVQQAADRSRQLMEKLGLTELETEPPSVQVADVALPARLRHARRFGSVQELYAAIRSGELTVQYAPRGEAPDAAVYELEGMDVTVKLAEADGKNYTVLSAAFGRSDMRVGDALVDDFAAEMRYVRMADFAYMRAEGECVYTMKVGLSKLSVASAATGAAEEADTAARIEKLHRDLGEMLEHTR